jgi:asparagine synthase (glutamine-hydrolysing)
MAHSVEGRFPYLDHRVIEFCNYLPPDLKLLGLCEKFLLRKLAKEWLPDEILTRPKQPYRAPIHRCFFSGSSPKYVGDLLSVKMIKDAGLFNPQTVSGLVRKIKRGMPLSETDDMALAGILSTQLVYQLFVNDFQMPAPISAQDDVKVCTGK